ncbi:MAG: hypothetical protein J2P19_22675, partial [Pseudonocardia sp.]|nr:hypothetical protein [Pseudonocardia sp.]
MADEKARQTDNGLDLSDLPEIFEPEEQRVAESVRSGEDSAGSRASSGPNASSPRPGPRSNGARRPAANGGRPANPNGGKRDAKGTASGADDRPASAERTSQVPAERSANDQPEVDADSARTTAVPIPPSAHAPPADPGGTGDRPIEQPTTAIPAPQRPPAPDWDSRPTSQIPPVHAPIPAPQFPALPPRPPVSDAATTQANRKLAWLLAGVVAVAGGLLIGFLRANTPANVPVPLVTPQPAAEQDGSSTQAPSDALSQPLMNTPEPTSTPTAPPPSPVAAPPVRKVAPKPAVRAVRPRVPVKTTTTKPTTTT